jgi:hypothetical protein
MMEKARYAHTQSSVESRRKAASAQIGDGGRSRLDFDLVPVRVLLQEKQG